MSALLDAAALAERLADELPSFVCNEATVNALRLLAGHARASLDELGAWRRLALALENESWVRRRGDVPTTQDMDEVEYAEKWLMILGIDPRTGTAFPSEEPR